MKTIVTATMILVAAGVGFRVGSNWHVSAAAAAPVVTAQGLRIVDAQGSLRAAIAVSSQTGATSLSIFDPSTAKSRVVVGVRPDGVGTIELRDSAGAKRGELISMGAGAIRLALWDQDSQSASSPRLTASVDPRTGVASFSMFGSNGSKPRLLMGVRSDGIGSLEFRDSDGNKRGELTAAPSGEIRLNLLDKDLKGGVLLGSSAGQTALVFNDSQSKHRGVFSLDSSGDASAKIYDKDSKVLWQAPPTGKN